MLYQRNGRPTLFTNAHIILGRVVVVLGMINGGLGLSVYDRNNPPKAFIILYSLVAALVGLAYIIAWLWDRHWREGWRRRNLSEDAKHRAGEASGEGMYLSNLGGRGASWRDTIEEEDVPDETRRLVSSGH